MLQRVMGLVLLDQAALDPYVYMRSAYLQRHRSLIYDGSPRPGSACEPGIPHNHDALPAAPTVRAGFARTNRRP